MKRIIALIASALYAVFSNLSPVLPKDAPFLEDSYYQVAESGEVDYSKLYAEYFSSQAVYAGACDFRQVVVDSSVKPVGANGADNSLGFYWLLESDSTVSLGSLDSVWDSTDKDGLRIVAPTECTLAVSHNNCDFGRSIAIEVPVYGCTYRLTFSNVKCWWCCRNKEEPEDGKYTLSAGATDPRGTTFGKGNLIAIATDTTTVNITRADQTGLSLTLDQFYSLTPSL